MAPEPSHGEQCNPPYSFSWERPLTRGFRGFQLQFATNPLASPGGKPEEQDQGDPVSTLRREADEEAAAQLGGAVFFGHVTDPSGRRAYLRYASPLTGVGPARPDPATGHTYTRVLATPEQAMRLFDWGPPAADQLVAVHQARLRLGIPEAAPQPVTELTGARKFHGGHA